MLKRLTCRLVGAIKTLLIKGCVFKVKKINNKHGTVGRVVDVEAVDVQARGRGVRQRRERRGGEKRVADHELLTEGEGEAKSGKGGRGIHSSDANGVAGKSASPNHELPGEVFKVRV